MSSGTTRAALARKPDEPLEVVEMDCREVDPGEVRVRVRAAGVCHSDLSMVDGTLSPQFPVVLGHEASGTVAEVGDSVSELSAGDHVVFNWAPPCRRCWHCLRDEPWLCTAVEGIVTAPGCDTVAGESTYSCLGIGAFAEDVVVPEESLVRVDPDLPFDVAALLGCAVLTGMGAVRNTAAVRPGDSVAVLGLGGIGLSAIAGARWSGANPIIAVDVREDKEPLARAMGATDFVVADEPVAKAIRTLTSGRGADHTFECIGRPDTIRTAWQAARRGGQVVIVGVGGRSETVSFNPLELFHFNRTLRSSIYGGSDPARDIGILASLVLAGRLDLSPLVTHRATLDGINDAFDRMRAGEGARTVIEFPADP